MVTALFADVVGSTAMAESMDPEHWAGLMNRAFDQISKPIYHYEGSIARLMGDALLAFFGAPIAHEDDPVRAVNAALDLLASTAEFAESVRADYGQDFQMRVGINTGPVVVGEIGSDLKYEYTAMGDAVNLAARMQAAASPGAILISEETGRFVQPVFELKSLGPIDVKGKSEPVNVFEVLGRKERAGRLRGLDAAGISSPMIGRAKDLEALMSATATLSSDSPQYVAIIGEAGLGKSRLVTEWQRSISKSRKKPLWVTGQCLSYGRGLAYHLVIDLVRNVINAPATASNEETQLALTHTLEEIGINESDETLAYLAHLLSIGADLPAIAQLGNMDPQLLQAQYLRSVQHLCRALSRNQPLILVFEDIHWSDPSSTDLLLRLIGDSDFSDHKIMFCFITRPDHQASGWEIIASLSRESADRLTTVELASLSAEESRMLISSLLEVEALPKRARDAILAKTEGNPFFMEEVVRMLIDQDVLGRENGRWVAKGDVESIQIPDTLQGLLLARIDHLPEDTKQTLRVASVIGRQFAVRVLESVLGRG
ncbi:MAG: AAA family ATPase [Chloroflexi bacterium]|nr:AAA family ATPase [Chloroflexota bacterium]